MRAIITLFRSFRSWLNPVVLSAILALLAGSLGMAMGGTVELLQNGNFEAGDSVWKVNDIQDAEVFRGPYPNRLVDPNSRWYGFVGDRFSNSVNAIGSLFQDFDVPPNATTATLTFWLNIRTFETGPARDDLMDVNLRRIVGNTDPLLAKLETYANTDGSATDGAYDLKTLHFDLTQFRGQTLRLQFYADTDPNRSTVFRIDDVSFVATVSELNLTPFQPQGWDEEIVISKQPNSSINDTGLTVSDAIYVSWAGINSGNSPTWQAFYSTVYLDEEVVRVWQFLPPVNPDVPFKVIGHTLGRLPIGLHTIRLKVDSGIEISETSESDNEYTRTFSIADPLVLNVDSPNSGNPMSACGHYPVSWTATGDTAAISHFRFGYSTDGGNNFTDLSDAIPAAERSFLWTVPSSARSTRVRVRISAYNSSGQLLASAFNSSDLTIQLASGKPTARPETRTTSLPPDAPAQFYGRNSTPSSACSFIASYRWEFPGGVIRTESNPTFTFSAPANGSATYHVRLQVTDANDETDTKTLPIYVSGFSLGAEIPSSFSLDPVNLATGNYVYEHIDLRIPGKGFPFEFRRSYNSKFFEQTGQPMGFAWSHSYNLRLSSTASNATVTFGDGHSEVHVLDGGQYKSEAGVYDSLTNNLDGSFTLTGKDQTRRNFDSQGRLASIVDKNGNTLSLAYDGSRLTNVTDTAGRQIVFESDPDTGLLTRITDSIHRSIQFRYEQTNLVEVIDANGGTNRFEYDANHQMTAAFDARGTRFVQNIYDELQRIVSYQTDAYTNQSGFSYDFVNRVTYVTNALGKISIHRHDHRLLVTNIVDEANNEQSFAYDTNRNRIHVRDKNGNETHYGYDERGNVLTKIDALSNVTAIAYNSLNNPIRRVDTLTNATTFGYDEIGNLTSTTNALGHVSRIQYTNGGLPFILIDARGFGTTNEFDPQGNLAAVIDAKGFANRYEYDPVGRRIRHIDPLNRTNLFFHDDNDNLLYTVNALGFTNSFTYDGNNNRTSSRDARGVVTSNIFDLKDRLVAVLGPLNYSLSNRYDALDRKLETRDARGNPTWFAFDDVGNLIAITNALREVTRFTHDPNGNQTSVIDPTGQHYITNFFDALNRKVATIDIGVSTNLTVYDKLGRVAATTNANRQVTQFFHNAIGRLTNVVDSAGKSVFFNHDTNGNRVHITDPNGHTWTNAFDELNRLVEQSDPQAHKTFFRHDPVGNITNKVTPNGHSISYSHDALNRLTSITYPAGPPVSFAYDPVGNRTNMTDSLGTTSWEFDELNRLKSVTDPHGQTVINGFDVQGNRVSLTYPGNKVVHYGFDALNRMAALTNWLNEVVTYAYDSRGNLVATTNANDTTVAYGFDGGSRLVALTNARPDGSVIARYALVLDGIGNHLQSTHEQPLFPILPNQTNNYAYDSDNRLTSIDSQIVIHDENGNLTSIGSQTFAYDFEDRLIEFALTNAAGSCAYDGLGNRLARTVDGETRRFMLDRMAALTQVLIESDTNNSPIAYYAYGLGLAQRISADGQVATYHFDVRGSTVAITDSGGFVTDSYAFDSFGVLANSEGGSPQPFRYLGRHGIITDSKDLYHARARHFSPQLGRFLTKDPLTGRDGDGQSLNRYVYALNNPMARIDPSGMLSSYTLLTAALQFSSGFGNALGAFPLAIFLGAEASLTTGSILPLGGAIVGAFDTVNESSKEILASFVNVGGAFYDQPPLLAEDTIGVFDNVLNAPGFRQFVAANRLYSITASIKSVSGLVNNPQEARRFLNQLKSIVTDTGKFSFRVQGVGTLQDIREFYETAVDGRDLIDALEALFGSGFQQSANTPILVEIVETGNNQPRTGKK